MGIVLLIIAAPFLFVIGCLIFAFVGALIKTVLDALYNHQSK